MVLVRACLVTRCHQLSFACRSVCSPQDGGCFYRCWPWDLKLESLRYEQVVRSGYDQITARQAVGRSAAAVFTFTCTRASFTICFASLVGLIIGRKPPALPWPDIGHLAKWSVSSFKFGFGPECLQDEDPDTFWQLS